MNPRDDIDRALALYRPIGLAELDDASLMDRVDTKFALPERLLVEFLEALAEDYRVLEVDGDRRSPYSTLYFDTPSRDCYMEHQNGRATRHKFRMRSYGSSRNAFFEVKQRTNKGRTIKRRVEIPAIRPSLGPESLALAESVAGKAVKLRPQIRTAYRRVTLVSLDATERVTIDTDIEFRDGPRRVDLPGVAIAEVKQTRLSRRSPVLLWLRAAGVRPQRLSKYCVGSAMLDPSLKHNRFKTDLLALGARPH